MISTIEIEIKSSSEEARKAVRTLVVQEFIRREPEYIVESQSSDRYSDYVRITHFPKKKAAEEVLKALQRLRGSIDSLIADMSKGA